MTAALLDHLWQSTLFCVAVWLITLALRNNSAALRHQLWLLASAKFLIPFAALYYLGALAGLPTPVGVQPVLFTQAIEITAPVISPTSSLPAVAAGESPAIGTTLLALWATGACFMALRWINGWRAANILVRAARPAPGSSLDARVTDADIEPAVARVFHPVVLLPVALLGRLSSAQMDAVLAHEREHITRHDNLKASIHHLVETLFWFHPAVWWIGRQMLEERERACDEAVIENGYDAHDYAAGILAVCRHCCNGAGTPFTSSALSGNLTQRIRLILASARPAALGFAKGIALSAATLLVATAPLFAGAFDDAAHRRALLAHNERQLDAALIYVSPTKHPRDADYSLDARADEVVLETGSLRELVALAYGVRKAEVMGGGNWLDDARYDIRAVVPGTVAEPEDFDPLALRGLVNKLLASRFDLEIRVHTPPAPDHAAL